jgi:hypothetical protein
MILDHPGARHGCQPVFYVMIKKYSIMVPNRQLFKIAVLDIFLGGTGLKFTSNLKQIKVEIEIWN